MEQDSRSISRLIGDAFSQFGDVVQNEIWLARAEISQKASQAKSGAVLLGISVVVMVPALVMAFISFALWLGERGFSAPAAHLIPAAAGTAISVIVAAVGMSRLKSKNLAPKITMRELGRDVAAAKGMVK